MYVDVYGNCAICSVSKDNYVGNGVDVKYLAVNMHVHVAGHFCSECVASGCMYYLGLSKQVCNITI